MVHQKKRKGIFLVVTLVVIAVSTMAAYSFTDLMLAYDEATLLVGRKTQAEKLVESGVEFSRLIVAQPLVARDEFGGTDNNPTMFQAINVVPNVDPQRRGNFTIIAPAMDELGNFTGVRYGLQNESARLNVNVLPVIESTFSVSNDAMQAAAELGLADVDAEDAESIDNVARNLLMALPNMTDEVADAILDWLDEDDEERDFGAEYDYYEGLPTPYAPKNGPIDSVEELLLVRGVTPELLFGADVNRNGIIDPAEQNFALSGQDTAASLGWSAFMTVHSKEGNKTSEGLDRINVNDDDLEQLYEDLGEALGNDAWASFIVAYRVAGQSGSQASQQNADAGGEVDIRQWDAGALDDVDLSEGKVQLTQLLDLVGATVQIRQGEENVTFASPFAEDPISMALYMPAIMGNLTSQDYDSIPGRINLNECPAELIYGLPLLDDETKQAIIDARGEESDSENRYFETWPLVEGLVTLDQMRQFMPLLTSGGDVFRTQVIGYFEGANQSSRAEVIIDATTINPDIVFWRNLSHLGRGFDIGTLGVRTQDGVGELTQQ